MTDVYGVGKGDFIKVGGRLHEITGIQFRRKDGRPDGKIIGWTVETATGRSYGMLEIQRYFTRTETESVR